MYSLLAGVTECKNSYNLYYLFKKTRNEGRGVFHKWKKGVLTHKYKLGEGFMQYFYIENRIENHEKYVRREYI